MRNFILLAAIVIAMPIAAQINSSRPLGQTKVIRHEAMALNDNERIVGLYTTDDLPDMEGGYIRVGDASSISEPIVGVLFNEDMMQKYVGGQLTHFRFAVACDVSVYSAYVYTVTGDLDISSEAVATVEINETLTAGWHDITLAEPVTIASGCGYLLGFSYREARNIYPLATDLELDTDYTSDYGILACSRNKWTSYTGYGSICLQAAIDGGSFVDDDLALTKLTVDTYALQDDGLNYSFKVRNDGLGDLDSYAITLAIDDDIVETLTTPIDLTNVFTTITGNIDLSSTALGDHYLTVSIADINGSVPMENTYDDTLREYFGIYDGTFPDRQMHLIENFTSTTCTNCYYAHDVIELMQENNPGKYAWVALHYTFNSSSPDPYYFSDEDYYYNFEGVVGYPSAAFDRFYFNNTTINGYDAIAMPFGWTDTEMWAAEMDRIVDEAYEDIPAIVTVDIDRSYDSDTRVLTITVSGDGNGAAKTLLADSRLTIFITEDGIIGPQDIDNKWDYEYVHNHVLRACANEYPWGDDINWTSGSTYANTVTITLDDTWDADNVYITAFISGPMKIRGDYGWEDGDIYNANVNNANSIKATDTPSGITAINNTTGIAQQYYAPDGRLLATPQRGLNLLRHSDGTTKKVIIR